MNGLALFAGVAGLDLGVRLTIPSARTVCYVEGEAYAASVLVSQMEKGGLHEAPIWSNVVTFDGKPWRGKVDFITGGFPCQPWSKAGKLKKTEDERWLWFDIERIICEVRPQYLFLENVPGIIDGGISHILKSLAETGYNAEWGCLRASEVGANHQRDRAFIFAYCAERGCTLSNYDSNGFYTRWFSDQKCGERITGERGMEGNKSSIMRQNVPDSNSGGFSKNKSDSSRRESNVIGGGSNVPDSDFGLSSGKKEEILSRGNISFNCRSDVPDSNNDRQYAKSIDGKQIEGASKSEDVSNSYCKRINESGENLSTRVIESNGFEGGISPDWWQIEPSVGRVVNGLAHRVDRLRACGNGVVPLQAGVAYSILIQRAIDRGCLNGA